MPHGPGTKAEYHLLQDEDDYSEPTNLNGLITGKTHYAPPTSDEEFSVISLADAVSDAFQRASTSGTAMIEGMEAVWSPRTKAWFIVGFALQVVILALDTSTLDSYSNYALSEFRSLSMQGTLGIITAVLGAVAKMPIAKLCDVLGRAEMYCFGISSYMVSYILSATAQSFGSFAASQIFATLGHAVSAFVHILLIADVTSMHTRGMWGSLVLSPVLITTWISGFIVDRVVNGIGWRWGYGMFAIMLPFGAFVLISNLLFLQHKARQAGQVVRKALTPQEFSSQIDLGCLLLVVSGLALLLLPFSLASKDGTEWTTPWVPALIALGAILLACIWPYERFVARHPAIPVRYWRMRAIAIPFILGLFDASGFIATHTYLFPWAVAAHNYSSQIALYLNSTNGIAQVLTGLITGYAMYKTRRYKIFTIIGSVVRLVGYGVMMRLRRNDSSDFELFFVQIVQGVGAGMLETTVLVAVQIVVSHVELAQVTALVAMSFHIGGSIGAAIAGGLYTSYMRDRLRFHLGPDTSTQQINDIYDSITGTLPAWGTPQRAAVGAAYSDVVGYLTYAAFAASVPVVLLACMFPNDRLGTGKNLVDEEDKGENSNNVPLRNVKVSI